MNRPNILGVKMEYVQIPLNIAQKAMRAYRPLLPYVRKRLAELRQENKEIIIPDEIIEEKPKGRKKK
jgi:hypothetical protein